MNEQTDKQKDPQTKKHNAIKWGIKTSKNMQMSRFAEHASSK